MKQIFSGIIVGSKDKRGGLLRLSGLAALHVFTLSACSSTAPLPPIRACAEKNGVRVCYDGAGITVDYASAK